MTKNKIPYIEFLPIIIIVLIIFKLLDSINSIVIVFLFLLRVLQPLFWALGISYLINPLMKFFEKKLKIKRFFSILLSYTVVIGIISGIITIILPMIIKNISDLIANFDSYRETAVHYFYNVIEKSPIYKELNVKNYINLESFSANFDNIPEILNSILDGMLNIVLTVFSGLFNIIVGFIIAIYLLNDKEKFIVGIRKIIYSTIKIEKANKMIMFSGDVNKIFSKYIRGKSIDSVIIGLLCFIGLIIIGAPYAMLLSIIVGVTNMIPYFGPFIGMIPAILLTLFFNPITALWVGLFIFGLQQFDAYYLSPKILGDSVGLSPFWIILGIILGGNLMGILGMLLAVPIIAVSQLFFSRIIDKKLLDKDIIIE